MLSDFSLISFFFFSWIGEKYAVVQFRDVTTVVGWVRLRYRMRLPQFAFVVSFVVVEAVRLLPALSFTAVAHLENYSIYENNQAKSLRKIR